MVIFKKRKLLEDKIYDLEKKNKELEKVTKLLKKNVMQLTKNFNKMEKDVEQVKGLGYFDAKRQEKEKKDINKVISEWINGE